MIQSVGLSSKIILICPITIEWLSIGIAILVEHDSLYDYYRLISPTFFNSQFLFFISGMDYALHE